MKLPDHLTDNGVVRVSMSHLCDIALYQEEIPYEIWKDDVKEDVQRTNVKLKVIRDIQLTDIKSLESTDKPELETHGFEWFHQQYPTECGIKSADDVATASPEQRECISRYLRSMTQTLKENYGCVKVICYDWRVCLSSTISLAYTKLIIGRTVGTSSGWGHTTRISQHIQPQRA